MSRLIVLVIVATLGGACASELGESCEFDSQCPTGSICRADLYLDALCEEGVVPIESTGPDGYCTLVCVTDEDCGEIPGSDGCKDDPNSGRNLCMPDCP